MCETVVFTINNRDSCSALALCSTSLTPRPRPLMRKRVWWLLSNLLLVLSQRIHWFSTNIDYMLAWCRGLFHWFMQLLGWHGTISLACPKSRLLTQHNQERNCSVVTGPFSPWESGSGHETSCT